MSVFEESTQYRPFKYPWAMELAVEHNTALYWDTHQITMLDDYKQFHTQDGLATDNVVHDVNAYNLSKNLNIFTQMDMAAGALYCELLPYVKNNEIRNMWMTFAARESVHQRAYAMAVEELGFPDSTWGEFMEYAEMQRKIDVMTDLDNRDHSKPLDFAKTLAQLLLAEGICLFGAFACMLNLKRFGLMMGTNLVNEWSLRDEERHVTGNVQVLDEIRIDLTKEENKELNDTIYLIVNNYVDAEMLYLDLVFEKGPQEGMTKEDMKEYIKYLADLRLGQLSLTPQYDTSENPLGWMSWVLSGKNHTNFFEDKVTEYTHKGLNGDIDYSGYATFIMSDHV